MDNVFTYLKWRGDLDFSASAFNEIDSLILSLIAYVDFDGIVHGLESEEFITLKKAFNRYWELHEAVDDSNTPSFFTKPPRLLKEAANTKRFGKIRIGKYVNRIDTQKEEQFSAITFQLNVCSIYLAFKGTDANIVGWKEDFNMCYIPVVPAQREAVEYLEKAFSSLYREIRLGGHSKGGNLAVYSAIKCRKQIRDRIVSVDNFDGPGFIKDILASDEYARMLPRITNYVPQSSLIGLLLEHSGENKIVRSSQFGIWQHDAFTWEADALNFPCVKDLDKGSLLMDSIIKEWINKLDLEQRESFVSALFGVLTNIGIERITDFSKVSNDKIRIFFRSINSLPTESREILTKAIRLFFAESRIAVKKQIKDNFRLFSRK